MLTHHPSIQRHAGLPLVWECLPGRRPFRPRKDGRPGPRAGSSPAVGERLGRRRSGRIRSSDGIAGGGGFVLRPDSRAGALAEPRRARSTFRHQRSQPHPCRGPGRASRAPGSVVPRQLDGRPPGPRDPSWLQPGAHGSAPQSGQSRSSTALPVVEPPGTRLEPGDAAPSRPAALHSDRPEIEVAIPAVAGLVEHRPAGGAEVSGRSLPKGCFSASIPGAGPVVT